MLIPKIIGNDRPLTILEKMCPCREVNRLGLSEICLGRQMHEVSLSMPTRHHQAALLHILLKHMEVIMILSREVCRNSPLR